jgi:hypothetical protein
LLLRSLTAFSRFLEASLGANAVFGLLFSICGVDALVDVAVKLVPILIRP